jgi:uncharacterized protein YndB with AHSA1/START domain
MSIAPIRHIVDVKGTPAQAFMLFATRMADWWPKNMTPGEGLMTDLVMEACTGGKFYEIKADGAHHQWGTVLAWNPPGQLLICWQLGKDWMFDADLVTEVELTFEPAGEGRTRMTLEHRHLERFGALAEERRAQLDGGWPTRLADYVAFADAQALAESR